jgi:L-fuconolactonase
MRIDAHQHFWHFDPVRDSWITEEMSAIRRDFLPRDLEPLLAREDIRGTVAVQADQSEDETRFLLELSEEHPFIMGVVGWVDLLGPVFEERLQHFSGFERFKGVRHIAQAEADHFLARGDVVQRIGMLADFGLTYDILVYQHQLPAVLSLVRRLPNQPFVLDHMAKPLIGQGVVEPWATHMKELASHGNVWCKVSGMVTEAKRAGWSPKDFVPYLDAAFEAFGPDRLMFGSDWPVCLLAAGYDGVVGLVEGYVRGLSESEREGILGGNAVGFYGLSA